MISPHPEQAHLHTVDITGCLHDHYVCVLIEDFVGDWAVVHACEGKAVLTPLTVRDTPLEHNPPTRKLVHMYTHVPAMH